ncbi:MAG: phosphodiester glycosidase family protein [Clostridia bacterium]|nr:phosphodiester glycosidase family protein [Clostridia bacterium]
MKKTANRLVAILLVLALFLPMYQIQADAAFGMTYVTGHTVKTGVSYAKYNVTSKVNGNTLACTTLTFNPANGYIPMAFQGYAGTSGTLATQYSIATNKYGYSVAGIINGAFFSMGTPYGTLSGMCVSNGKIVATHLGYSDQVVAFGSDGSVNMVGSTLKHTITIGGKSYADMIYYINKTSGSASASNWSERFYYFDTSCGTKCDSYSVCPGTEILCKKVDNTDLAIGQTLVGEVVSVTKNTYGGSLGDSGVYSDKFILFMRSGSSYEYLLDGVKAGDTIKINTEETIAASKEVMENANSVITNVGWLVKNGVDQTLIQSTIGTHSVTLQARWTAFGQKADGTYVFFTSEGGSTGSGGSLTLRDVAQAMINMGCTNVIRMDGGGSSAMYVSNTGSGSAGYVQSSSRAISDCILVVSRASATSSTVKSALNTAISNAEAVSATAPSAALTAAITSAKAVYNSSTSIMGDHKREIMELRDLSSGKGALEAAMNNAMSISIAGYPDIALDRIDYAYMEAKRLLKYGTDAEMMSHAAKITDLINRTTTNYNRLSLGASYSTIAANTAYPDAGISEMTDGELFGAEPTSSQWTGYKMDAAHGYVEGKGYYVDILVDLGEEKTVSGFGVSTLQYTTWGITAPPTVEVYASDNGADYYLHSTLKQTVTPVSDQYQVVPYEGITNTLTTDRYIVFRLFFHSTHLFVGEVSVYGQGGEGRSDFTSFNSRIATDNTVIFDANLGTATHSNANLTWSHGYLCDYDSTAGRYVVKSIVSPNGATDYSYAISSGSIIVGLHGASYTGNANALSAAVGDYLYVTGIDIAAKTVYPGARLTFVSPASDVSYKAPNVSPVKGDSGSAVTGSYVSLPQQQMTSETIAELFTDSRITVSGAGTGATVKINATGEVFTLYLLGDVNGDNSVSSADCLAMKTAIKTDSAPTGAYFMAADYNCDNSADATDYFFFKTAIN